MRYLCLILLWFCTVKGVAQTLGGSAVFNFMNLPVSPQVSALGGINISQQNRDASLVYGNPALIRKELHQQLSANVTSFFAGIRNLHLQHVWYSNRLETGFSLGINYLTYGDIPQTDAIGNQLGSFRPNDFVIQLSASRIYENRWHYGLALKYIQSNYGMYKSNALAFDMGLTYTDSANRLQAALVVKNMGAQLTVYNGTSRDELPFDLQLGLSKRLKKAPFQFSVTAHHLHRWDLQYNDTLFNQSAGGVSLKTGAFTPDNIFRHFVFSVQAYIGKYIEATLGYNYLRRQELKLTTAANGLNGFSLGLGLIMPKLQIRYARSYYQNTSAYNQIGINVGLQQYFGLGK